MEQAILAAVLALTFGQAGTRPFAGAWNAEFEGTTFIRLELRMTDGALGGRISLGNIQVNSEGDVHTAAIAPRELTPIFDVVLRESTLSFSRKDGEDTDHFEMRLVGDHAELRFIPSEADRRELAESGIAVPKPVRLTRVEK